MSTEPVWVLGAGAWGTALALVLARNGVPVFLWGRSVDAMQTIQKQRENKRYLPGVTLPDSIQPVTSLPKHPLSRVVLSVPCAVLPEILEKLKEQGRQDMQLCLTMKGLDEEGRTVMDLAKKHLPSAACSILSGPSFALEVARQMPTGVTLAAETIPIAKEWAELFHCERFRVYTHDDVIGVCVGGAAKNVIAIAAGASDGLGLGGNARAVLLTRGLAEVTNLGVALGARRETFMGLAGLGDIALSCGDDQSRNRRLGFLLATQSSVDAIIKKLGGATVEGARTASILSAVAEKHGVSVPIIDTVTKVLKGEQTVQTALEQLSRRPQKTETV